MEHPKGHPGVTPAAGEGLSTSLLGEILAEAGFQVFPGAAERLSLHATEMVRWNRAIRLTAITDPAEVAVKHVVDSLMLLRFAPFPGRLLDFGSGAGYPGIPLALFLPGTRITLVEASAKKIAFLSRIRGMLRLPNLQVVHGRLGGPNAPAIPPQDHIVTRATAPPGALLSRLSPYLAEGGRFLFMLGPGAGAVLPEEYLGCRIRRERFSLPRGMGEREILEVDPAGGG